MTATVEEDLSRMFAALADPTRRAILRRLASGDATVNELAAPFDLTQQAVSRHIKVLEAAGLVSRARAAQTRPCRLEAGRLSLAEDWILEQRELWAARHDRLETYLQTLDENRQPGEPSS